MTARQLSIATAEARRCDYCNDPLGYLTRSGRVRSARARYCSGRCKVAAFRAARRGVDVPVPRDWAAAERRAATPSPARRPSPARSCVDTSALSQLAILRGRQRGATCIEGDADSTPTTHSEPPLERGTGATNP